MTNNECRMRKPIEPGTLMSSGHFRQSGATKEADKVAGVAVSGQTLFSPGFLLVGIVKWPIMPGKTGFVNANAVGLRVSALLQAAQITQVACIRSGLEPLSEIFWA